MNAMTSSSINIARFPLAVLVVFIHSVGPENGAYYPFRLFFSHEFTTFVVPTFFIISGYLFFNGGDLSKQRYIRKIKSRIHTLLIPFVFWNVLTLVLDYLKYVNGHPSWIDYGNNNIKNILMCCFWGNPIDDLGGLYFPINLPLWYIRDLIVLCVISPLLWSMFKYKYVGFSLVVLLGSIFVLDLKIPYFNIVSILFFSIGAVFALSGKNLVHNTSASYCGLIGFSTVCLTLYFVCGNQIALNIYTCVMPFTALSIAGLAPMMIKEKLSNFAKYSTIVYYSHYPITLIIAIKATNTILPYYSLINYIIIPLVASVLSIVLKEMYNKFELYGISKG